MLTLTFFNPIADHMPIHELYSRRQQRLRGEVPEVFVYDDLPKQLRVQIVHLLNDYLGREDEQENTRYLVGGAYTYIVNTLCREYGEFRLASASVRFDGVRTYVNELHQFILSEANVERVLDAVELSMQVLDAHARTIDYRGLRNASERIDEALSDINVRFQQAGVGYRFEDEMIVRVDSELLHAEVVKPALVLLRDPLFKGAEDEFHAAYTHFRHSRHKAALSECLKALESTIKAIATKRKWAHDPKATAKTLIDLMFKEQLIPDYWSNHFGGVRSMLEGGVPTVRNRVAGHGQGTELVEVPAHFVSFALHQVAAAIVFLVASEKELK